MSLSSVAQIEIVRESPLISDTTGIIISQNSDFLLGGQEIEITVRGCSGNMRLLQVKVNGLRVKLDNEEKAVMNFPAGSIGLHTIPVEVVCSGSDGKQVVKRGKVVYRVGQANAVVSLTKLNVLYIGVENPVIIAASTGSETINASIEGGSSTITRVGPNSYTVRVNEPTDRCLINVKVNDWLAATYVYRVKHLPDPEARAGNFRSGSTITYQEFSLIKGVNASLPDFPFEVIYNTKAFSVDTYMPDGTKKTFLNAGEAFSQDIKKHISQLAPGSIFVIKDILVEEPGGRKVQLPAIIYHIK